MGAAFQGVQRHDGVHAPGDLLSAFVSPSPESFRRVLRLRHDDSAAGAEAQRRHLRRPPALRGRGSARRDGAAPGPGLRVRTQGAPWRDVDGALVVNGVRSGASISSGDETVVHVMAGVLMDAEFEAISFTSRIRGLIRDQPHINIIRNSRNS
ncbi:hypothetical protein ZWY2020_010374 [Hordeum vulgare]|nr:hypothetical protein ZWY2020_010374 [Hordeum vulgare]